FQGFCPGCRSVQNADPAVPDGLAYRSGTSFLWRRLSRPALWTSGRCFPCHPQTRSPRRHTRLRRLGRAPRSNTLPLGTGAYLERRLCWSHCSLANWGRYLPLIKASLLVTCELVCAHVLTSGVREDAGVNEGTTVFTWPSWIEKRLIQSQCI